MKISYDKLWKLLIDRKLSRTQLVHMAGITTNSMAKMGKDQEVRMDTLVKVCEILDCKIDDIIDYTV